MKTSKPIMKIAAWAARILPSGLKRLFYRIPFIARIIRRSLNAAAPQGFSEIVIAGGPAQGLRMVLNLQEEKDYWLGTYEPDLQAAAQKLVRKGDVVYDIGANIGYISLMCANLIGKNGEAHAFEPLPNNVERLTANIHLNQLEKRVRINHAAVVDKNGTVTFLTHQSGAMGKALGSAGRDEHYTSSITVTGVSLDSYIFTDGHPAPHLVKLDIEGGEGHALIGAKRMLAEAQPALLIELHGEQAARQVWDILAKNGYHVFLLEHGFPRVFSVDDLDWKAYIAALPKDRDALLT